MHQKRNGVQVRVGCGAGVAVGGVEGEDGGLVTGGWVVTGVTGVAGAVGGVPGTDGPGAAGLGPTGSGPRVVADTAGAPPRGGEDGAAVGAEADAERGAVGDAAAEGGRLPERCGVGGPCAPVADGGAPDTVGCGVGTCCGTVATGCSAAGAGGTPSEPFAASVTAPSPTTARPTTDTTIRPGLRRIRRGFARPPVRPTVRPSPRPAGSGTGPGTPGCGRVTAAASAGRYATGSGPVAGAPQPGQARAPFRWRRQGAQ
ncbi:hypothetical protein [Kitasatospora sp. NPDC002965]|uniref:hypothetical protein n=1 Tax=Kitasatospora sp. NPDC002965 TaxID=3154775 RepID=UPI0033B3E7CE